MASYQQGQPIEINDAFSADGVAANPTLLVYSILGPDGNVTIYTWPGDPEITNPSVGSFELSLDPPAFPGDYQYDVVATGAVTAARSASFTVLPNRATQTALQWAVQGPCTSWCDSQDVWDCCGQPVTTVGSGSMAIDCPVDMSEFAFEASQLLYELSGRIFAGQCGERTVRPCSSRQCGFQVLSRGYTVFPWQYSDYGWMGSYWMWDGNQGCGCSPLDMVLLSGYPVREIIEVKIDGVVVDPATYEVWDRRKLVRVRDPLDPGTALYWPACQNLDLPDTAVGTWSVTYRYGQDPPVLGVKAAAQLACQFYRQCAGGECELPNGVTRIVRQGLQIDRGLFSSWAQDPASKSWRTGLTLVDAFLQGYNPGGLTRRPAIWAPGGPFYARKTGP